RVGEGADRHSHVEEAAPLAGPAGAAQEAVAASVSAGAAGGLVEDEQAVADVPIRELIPQAAALASAAGAAVPGAAAVAARGADRFVALAQAIADMKGRADKERAVRVVDDTARARAAGTAITAHAAVAAQA